MQLLPQNKDFRGLCSGINIATAAESAAFSAISRFADRDRNIEPRGKEQTFMLMKIWKTHLSPAEHFRLFQLFHGIYITGFLLAAESYLWNHFVSDIAQFHHRKYKKKKMRIHRKYMNIFTSPKAPLPIMVRRSKSSTHILCLFNRIYSVSLLSKSFSKLICSSSGTCDDSNSFCSTERLKIIKSHEKQNKMTK